MKVSFCLFLLTLSFTALHAQEAVPDTVATEEEYQYIEDDSDDEEDSDYDEEEEAATPSIQHELVSPDKLPATQDHARSTMTIRKFDNEEWKKVVGSSSFEEAPDKPKEEEEDSDKPMPEAPTMPWDSEWLRIIAYVIVIALILSIVYFFTKDLRFSPKVKPSELPTDDFAAHVENIEHIDVTTPLQKALAEGNFKLATRLYFLDLLKKLNETGYITWKKDKTNRDYLMELYSKGFYFNEIRKLTLAYELVWYGEHALSNETYQKLFSEFESIYNKINTSAAA